MSTPPPTRLQALLFAVVDAADLAETLGHPAAKPLAAFAETLRAGEDQPETERIAAVLAGWLALADRARLSGYQLTRPRPVLAVVPGDES